MRIESGHKSPFGYHTLEIMTLPNGKRAKVLVWHDTDVGMSQGIKVKVFK